MKEAMDFGCTFCGKTSWTGEELVTRSVCLDKTTTRVNNYCMLTAFGNTWFPYDMPMDIRVTSICPSRLINRQITSCGLHKCKKLCTMTSHTSQYFCIGLQPSSLQLFLVCHGFNLRHCFISMNLRIPMLSSMT